jgi:hypothetical protein
MILSDPHTRSANIFFTKQHDSTLANILPKKKQHHQFILPNQILAPHFATTTYTPIPQFLGGGFTRAQLFSLEKNV